MSFSFFPFFICLVFLASCDFNTGAGSAGRDRVLSEENSGPQATQPDGSDSSSQDANGSSPNGDADDGPPQYQQAEEVSLKPELQLQGLIEELQSTRRIGCRGREVLANVEIRVNGKHLDDRELGRSANRKTSGQEASRMLVSFADGIDFGFNESNQQLFSTESSYPTDELMAHFSSNLRYVEITKLGVGYRDTEVSEGGFLDEDVLYDSFETERYQLNSFAVFVNGEQVYQKQNIDFTFQEGSLVYRDNSLLKQPFWFAYQAESNCQTDL